MSPALLCMGTDQVEIAEWVRVAAGASFPLNFAIFAKVISGSLQFASSDAQSFEAGTK